MLSAQKLNLKPGVVLLFSLGCHSLFLVLPWPNYQRPVPDKVSDLAQSQAVQPPAMDVVTLPVSVSSAAVQQTIESPPPSGRQENRQTVSVAPFAEYPSDVASLSQVNVFSPAPASQPIYPDTYPEPVTSGPVPAEPVPAEQPSPLPENAALENAVPLSESPPEQGSEHEVLVRLGSNFPHLAGAQAGCYGLESCHQLSGNFRQAAQQLIAQLKSQGYQLTEREDIDGTGHRVFEVIMPDDPNNTVYLNVYSPDVGSTVYVLTADILSLEQLQQLSV
ncbi:MAG: hypothetical protein AAFR12_20695 [Cyanobacteria bacterium J06626_6]